MAENEVHGLAEMRARLGLSVRKASARSRIARNTIEALEGGGGRESTRERYERFLRRELEQQGLTANQGSPPPAIDESDDDSSIEARIQNLRDGTAGPDVESREIIAILAKAGSPEEQERLLSLIRIMHRLLSEG